MSETAEAADTKPARRSIGATRNPESEAAILAAAEAVLLENGLNGFSIEAVAKRARAGKPTIYRWWPSQAALLLDVYHCRKRTSFVFPDTGNIREDLHAYLTGILATWREGTGGEVFRSVVAKAQGDRDALAALSAYDRPPLPERQDHREGAGTRRGARGCEPHADHGTALQLRLGPIADGTARRNRCGDRCRDRYGAIRHRHAAADVDP